MSGALKTSAFQTGNSVAVRLPKAFGVHAGEELEIVKRGANIEIKVLAQADAARAKLDAFVRDMRKLGPTGGDPSDGRIDLPERPGLL